MADGGGNNLRALLEREIALGRELLRRKARERQGQRGGLIEFVKYFWHVLEPKTPFVDGWAVRAICDHLESITFGELNRFLGNVPPGFMKSMLVNVFWPAWEWGPMNLAHLRTISFSYASHLTERDNGKFRDLIRSPEYQALYGDRFKLTSEGVEKVANDATGWRYASSVGGVGTGERADRVVCLPRDVPVLTSAGWIEIGTIVERKLDVHIAGRNDATGRIEWQAIECHERNPGREILRIAWGDGHLDCTPEHPVFVQGRGYVAASEIRKGDHLVWAGWPFDLHQLRHGDQAQTELASEVLQQEMPVRAPAPAGSKGEQQTLQRVRYDGLQAARSLGALQGSLLQQGVPRKRGNWRRQSDVGWRSKSVPVRMVQQRIHTAPQAQRVLFPEVCADIAPYAVWKGSADSPVRSMWDAVPAAAQQAPVLLAAVQKRRARSSDGRERQRPLDSRPSGAQVPAGLDADTQGADQGPRWQSLSEVRYRAGTRSPSRCASHRLQQGELRSEQSDHLVPVLPRHDARQPEGESETETRVVDSVEIVGRQDVVYNIRVAPHHNYFAAGVLVHNCDDPHNIKDGESDTIRQKTVRWFDEAMSNRLNDLKKSAIIVIMQRVNEADVSGHIIENEPDYEHLMIPMEWDGRRYATSIGWTDPREEYGELAWPERYPEETLTRFRRNAFLWAGQYQQSPEPRGGGIFKRDWWIHEEIPVGKAPPPMEYIVASLDSAYTKNERNDPSGLSVWGIYRDKHGNPKVLLLTAWRKHLEMHGPAVERKPGESERLWLDRAKKQWGLVEWVAYECKRLKVDRLLIEAKASGITVAQEMQRLYANEGWGVELVDPEGDKYFRAMAVVHLWADGFVHVPASRSDPDDPDSLVCRDFAQLLIDEAAIFPNGRYRDITDSATQALKHLRSIGLAVRREEREEERLARSMHREKLPPLYPT